jgi:hypothetical protein
LFYSRAALVEKGLIFGFRAFFSFSPLSSRASSSSVESLHIGLMCTLGDSHDEIEERRDVT